MCTSLNGACLITRRNPLCSGSCNTIIYLLKWFKWDGVTVAIPSVAGHAILCPRRGRQRPRDRGVAIPSVAGHAILFARTHPVTALILICRNPLCSGSCNTIVAPPRSMPSARSTSRNPLCSGSCNTMFLQTSSITKKEQPSQSPL